MPVQIGTNIGVQGFGFQADARGMRLLGPRVEAHDLRGRVGGLDLGVAELLLDQVEGWFGVTRWSATAASLGGATLRDDSGRVDAAIGRIEMPDGIVLARAARGMELLSPHFALSEVKLTVLNPPGGPTTATPPAPAPAVPPRAGLRQERLRFLDSLAGHVGVTIKVSLDLPVIGIRTLDQDLAVRVQDGSLDYRALEEQLNWLEGKFLDLKHAGDRLLLTWRVPIFGPKHELLAWALDHDAATLGAFGRVPVRALADYRMAAREPSRDDERRPAGGLLRAFTLDAIDVALSLLAPRTVEIGGGVVAFGGDGQPGMVDLKVTGRIANRGPGALHGSIGALDTTIKDLRVGGAVVSADRLSIDGIDALEVEFDAFRPVRAAMVIHRVTATNLVVKLGE